MTSPSKAVFSKLLNSIPGITHGFGTRAEVVPVHFHDNWETVRPKWKQVHGVASIRVTAPGQECGEVDALYSRTRGIPIPIMTADCVPILMARRDAGAVATVHAGWRGTRAGIVQELWKRLRTEGEDPAQWVAAIGPSIGACCYEVSEEIADDFDAHFAHHGGVAVPAYRRLDLPALNAAELRSIGLEVDAMRACTLCSTDRSGEPLFASYRRDGSGTRQISVISLS